MNTSAVSQMTQNANCFVKIVCPKQEQQIQSKFVCIEKRFRLQTPMSRNVLQKNLSANPMNRLVTLKTFHTKIFINLL